MGGDFLYKMPCLYKGFEEYCPYNTKDGSCQMTTHHLWWPKRLYKRSLLYQFRKLACNRIRVCRGVHDLFHLINFIPKIPPAELMRAALRDDERRRMALRKKRNKAKLEQSDLQRS